MGELKTTHQGPGKVTTGNTPQCDPGDDNQGAEFGTRDRATRGTNRDADESGQSRNQGHGHPREERG